MAETCTHTDQIRNPKPKTHGCEECLKMGDTWVHLRLCEVCGHVGCCDSSKNKHASKHFRATKHPIVKSSNQAKTGSGATSTKLCLRKDRAVANYACVVAPILSW